MYAVFEYPGSSLSNVKRHSARQHGDTGSPDLVGKPRLPHYLLTYKSRAFSYPLIFKLPYNPLKDITLHHVPIIINRNRDREVVNLA